MNWLTQGYISLKFMPSLHVCCIQYPQWALNPEPQSQPICQNSSDPDIEQYFTRTGRTTDLGELCMVGPQYAPIWHVYWWERACETQNWVSYQ